MEPITYTLLIYEEVPDHMNLYLIPNSEIDDNLEKLLEEATGQYLGSDNDDGINKLYPLLEEGDHWDEVEEVEKPNPADLVKYKLPETDSKVSGVVITTVRRMGFYL